MSVPISKPEIVLFCRKDFKLKKKINENIQIQWSRKVFDNAKTIRRFRLYLKKLKRNGLGTVG